MSQPTTQTASPKNSNSAYQKPPHFERSDYQRVVITGMGAITPLGLDVETTWQRLIQGESGIKPITHFDASTYRAQFAGTIEGFDASQYMAAKEARRYDTFVHYGVAAASMALKQAGFIDEVCADPTPVNNVDADRFGVIIGAGIGGLQTLEDNRDALANHGVRKVSPFSLPGSIINMAAGMVAIKHNLRGPNLATATACTSAAHAIGLAARLIAYGDCDVMLAGGSEKGSSPLGMAGFAAMGALSTRNEEPTRASRPFDKDRDGFVLGDGAGVLVLESLAHAKARGATILAELAGFGMSDDAHHITAPEPTGKGAAKAMVNAVEDAGCSMNDVDYINTHATSTPLGDVAEINAIRLALKPDKEQYPPLLVSSTKGACGHMLGAAGAIEAALTCLSVSNDIVPHTRNLEEVSEDITKAMKPSLPTATGQAPKHQRAIHLVQHAPIPQTVNTAISNSFAFGGTNVSLVFGKT